MEPNQLIEKLGGSAKVADALNVASNTVGNWRKRGIPAWAMPALKKLCEDGGVDPAGALDPQPPRRARAEAAD